MRLPEFLRANAARLCAAIVLAASGCASPDFPRGGRLDVEQWAGARGFVRQRLPAGEFDLLALTRQAAPAATLVVYIEGDGAPWAGSQIPPGDPTPVEPMALALAAADPAPAVAWLARPCQYLDAPDRATCRSTYWIERRFAPEVIEAFDASLTRLKSDAGARRVRLVGYSGGGVIAALVAMRRDDVERLVTVAAPLALADWAAWHGLTPLGGSLDPKNQASAVPLAPGMHFAGANDRTVPAAIVERFVRSRGGQLVTVAGFDHNCCWHRDWADLLRRVGGMEDAR